VAKDKNTYRGKHRVYTTRDFDYKDPIWVTCSDCKHRWTTGLDKLFPTKPQHKKPVQKCHSCGSNNYQIIDNAFWASVK